MNNITEDLDLIGAQLLDPKSGISKIGNIYIRGGKIHHKQPNQIHVSKILDLKDHVILPGLLDLRVHNRVPGATKSENIESLTKAAARGGMSAILTMPDTNPYSDNPATIRYIQDRVNQTSKIKVYLSGCLTIGSKGENLAPLGSLKDAGVVAVTDCPNTPKDNQILTNALKYAKMFDLVVLDFPQDQYLTKKSHAHESALSLKMGLAGNPRMAEEIAVQRAILISKHLNVSIHISSISSAGSVTLIQQAKQQGVQVTTDVSAHHLLLNEDQISNYNVCAKTNPPLRQETDRLALIDGLKNGVIDACNSSHEPNAEHLTNVEFDKAPSGTIGLETAVLAFIEAVNENDPFPLLLEKMCYNPHSILNLDIPSLAEKSTANLVAIHKGKEWIYDSSFGMSLSCNTPLDGHQFQNKITLTASKGNISYKSLN